VPGRPSRGFESLLTAPRPLPDEEDPGTAAQPPVSSAGPEPAAAPAGGPGRRAASRRTSARTEREAPALSSSGELAGEQPVALTIRLRRPAAAALNSAWLDQRTKVNPRLSYPEFASEIVRLGLDAFKRRAGARAGASSAGGQ
jgi:hypothetical protein